MRTGSPHNEAPKQGQRGRHSRHTVHRARPPMSPSPSPSLPLRRWPCSTKGPIRANHNEDRRSRQGAEAGLNLRGRSWNDRLHCRKSRCKKAGSRCRQAGRNDRQETAAGKTAGTTAGRQERLQEGRKNCWKAGNCRNNCCRKAGTAALQEKLLERPAGSRCRKSRLHALTCYYDYPTTTAPAAAPTPAPGTATIRKPGAPRGSPAPPEFGVRKSLASPGLVADPQDALGLDLLLQA